MSLKTLDHIMKVESSTTRVWIHSTFFVKWWQRESGAWAPEWNIKALFKNESQKP